MYAVANYLHSSSGASPITVTKYLSSFRVYEFIAPIFLG